MLILHVAAAMGTDGVQRCARCGAVLKDFADPDLGYGCAYPEGVGVVVSPSCQAMVLSPSPADRPCTAGVIDDLTYESYRFNRQHSPHIQPERWARIFACADQLEARYQREAAAVMSQYEALHGGW